MIKIIINKIVYQLKNSYDEITFSEYLQLLLNNNSPTPNIDNINFLSNIPKELINDFIYNLALPHIEFITATDLFRCNLLPNHIEAIRVGQESFLKIETAKVIIRNNGDKNIIHCIGQIVEIYSNIENFNNLKVRDALPIANHFILELQTFFDSFKRLNEYKPTSDEVASGLSQLDYLGFYSLLDALTKSDITKREKIKEMPAFEVYNQLLVDFEKAMFQKRFNDRQLKK